jgi:hypothetical protein
MDALVRKRLLTLIAAVGFIFVAPTASAIPIDSNLYGHLNQRAVTVCGNNTNEDKSNACGPVAAANSLTYLRNEFELGGIPNDTLQIADSLSGYMACSCTDGTYLDEFIHGKRTYLDGLGYGPGQISIEYQTIWAGVDEPGLDNNAHNWPTFAFLMAQLGLGQDVELLISFNARGYFDANGVFQATDGNAVCNAAGNFIGPVAGAVLCQVQRVGGHFLTVNGVDNPLDNIYTIDPWGSDTTTVDGARIGSYGLSFANPWLDINGYLAGYETRIEAVVAESRVLPEADTLFTFAGGLIILVVSTGYFRSSSRSNC